MQPDLALAYSSRSGNGIGGMGWSLSGLSQISRCPATLEQDGTVAAVQLTASDRLCMDGQRLVATSGTYGQSGTTYTTELASFSRVTQLGGALNASTSYFKVETKSGDILYYGGTSTTASPARVMPGGSLVPATWMLERRQDRIGNLVRYAYTSIGNGETVLASILYTGFGSTDGDRHVEMTYESRPATAGANDVSSSYLAGALTLQTKRLKQIATYVGAQAVRQYNLRYDAASAYSGRSLLRGVTECGFADGTTTPVCRPETTFTWQEGPLRSDFHGLALTGLPTDREFSSMTPYGDIDGDGVPEMVVHYENPTAYYLVSLNADRTMRSVVPASNLGGAFALNPFYNRPADINKDGRADVYSWKVVSGAYYLSVSIWNNTTTAWQASAFTTYDLPIPGTPIAALPGDVNGDGFVDWVVTVCAAAPSNTCTLQVFLGQAGASPGVPAIASTPVTTRSLPYATNTNGAILSFYPQRLTDFDGDGLLDVLLTRDPITATAVDSPRTPQERDRAQMLWFSRNSGGTYALGGTGNEIASFAAMASPALEADETNLEAFTRTADVNGDGLEDLISVKIQPDGKGYWSVRFNTGGKWGTRLITANNRGLEVCSPSASNVSTLPFQWGSCADRWTPMFQSIMSIADTDNDGRAEILAPRSFALRMCVLQTDWINSEPQDHYYCPENPMNGQLGPNPPDFVAGTDRFSGFYTDYMYHQHVVQVDGSAYYMDSVRFVQGGAASVSGLTISTPIVKGGLTDTATTVAFGASTDLYGDGLEDYIAPVGLAVKPAAPGVYPYYSAYVYNSGDPTWGPSTLPDGTSASAFNNNWKYFIAENPGASSTRNPDGVTPQTPELLAMVTDGYGQKSGWTYYSLSSKAGRPAGDLPLYTVPGTLAARYVDDRHFYFASSMPVVSDMFQSDGVGDVRTWRYGYSEAMYHARGRGFQGFRTITEEDDAAGTRKTTTFSQKFPLTGQVEQVALSSLNRAYGDANGIYFLQQSYWRCNRDNRADTTACAPPNGNATVVFPFLDEQKNYTYDAATAASSGVPALLSFKRFFAADDTTCAGTIPITSGYDANGNLLASVWLTYDGPTSGDGSGGTRKFLGVHCVRTRTTYIAADTTNWWLDRLATRQVTTAITYNANIHPLPAGVSNPQQTVNTTYVWNADRTPAQETVQSGVTNQQKVTAFTYPASGNYGLPASITVTASGDTAGPRVTSTGYSADGYFPQLVTNALGHQVSTSIRASDGQPSLVTDANGLRTTFQYDAFGFNTLTQFRGATDGEYVAPDRKASRTWCSTPTSCIGGVLAKARTTVVQDGKPVEVTDADILARPIGTAHRLADGAWSYASKRYDQAGHVTAESQPYRAGQSVYWTQYLGFDLLGRPLQKVIPTPNQDGRGDRVTTYSYSGRTTNIQVCGSADVDFSRCLNLSRTTDSLGRYVETVDANGGMTKFWYDGAGNALAIRDANGNVVSAAYNALGQRTSSSDPNQGAWSFAYDALGEVLNQTDARGITTTVSYDKLGRPLVRSATYDYDGTGTTDTVTDSWSYDPAYGNGKEASNTRTVKLNGATTALTLRDEQTTYDTLSRPMSRTLAQLRADNVNSDSVTQDIAYDSYYGRPKAQGFGNGELLWLRYSKYGDLVRESNGIDGTDYRIVSAVNERGEPINETWSSGNITVVRSTQPQTGQVASIDYTHAGSALRNFDYAYDVFGNLGQQDLNNGATREVYTYDAVQRLTEATRTGGATGTVDYTYDAVGNLTSKSDFSTAVPGAYVYSGGTCGGGPNAVKAITLTAGGSRTYCYDAAGNMTADNAGLSARYDHTQRPLRIQRGMTFQAFDYSPAGERFRESGTDGETGFFGTLERQYLPVAQDKVYAGANTVITTGSGSRVVTFLLIDRLGSVDAIANSAGVVIETRGFDAFGKPRTGTWSDALPPRLGSTANTRHGFTGHEHLNSLELIHMNGRVYDYNLGRFMGVDPAIQAPLNSQSLNPYSYILNNPLAGTDPTGYNARCATKYCTDGGYDMDIGMSVTKIGGPDDYATRRTTGQSSNHPINNNNNNGASNRQPSPANKPVPAEKQGAAAQRDNLDKNKNESGVGEIPNPTITGGSGRKSSDEAELERLLRATTVQVGDPITSLPGETQNQFDHRIRDIIEILTETTGFEYRTAFSTRPNPTDPETTEYGVILQTQKSPFVSTATLALLDNGWSYNSKEDMHSHGILPPRYTYTALDVQYLRGATGRSYRQAGERAALSDMGGSRTAFSDRDIDNGFSKLVTPTGLLRGHDGGRGWVEEEVPSQ